jgi:hypothetical protein
MPSFTKDPTPRTPFGKNEYLDSTRDVKTDSYTVAASTVPAVTIDGTATKVLQPGTVMAKITSGGESGKIGPRDAGATDGRQTTTNIVGAVDTFLPWQLNFHDETVAVTFEAAVIGNWLLEVASGAWIAATGTTKSALATGGGANIALLVR